MRHTEQGIIQYMNQYYQYIRGGDYSSLLLFMDVYTPDGIVAILSDSVDPYLFTIAFHISLSRTSFLYFFLTQLINVGLHLIFSSSFLFFPSSDLCHYIITLIL